MSKDSAEGLLQRITEYLSNGGLFNPDLMQHDHVRDLLIDIRAHLAGDAGGGWIKCSERKPEEKEDVLLYCGWQICGFRDSVGYFTEDGVNPIHHVTHWRPLPLPPADDKGD